MIVTRPCRAKCDNGMYIIKSYPLDCDLPVCPVCGGLGEETDNAYLAHQVRRLRQARFAYCPFDSREHFLFPPPPYLRLQALHEMQSALRAMVGFIGSAIKGDCYAAVLHAKIMEPCIESARLEMADELATWQSGQIKRPENETLWHPIGLAIDGRLDQAEAGLKSILHNDGPPSVETLLYVAHFYVEYRRDWLQALKYLEEARESYPRCAEVHLELVAAYDALHREAETRLSMMDALDCPDAEDFPTLVAARRQVAERQTARQQEVIVEPDVDALVEQLRRSLRKPS